MTRRDPWQFQRWAFDTITGTSGRKAVLAMLAMMADAHTGRCEAKQETLAAGVEMTDRGVRKILAELEEQGLIARRAQRRQDGSRRGDEFLLLAPWIREWPDGEAAPTRTSVPDDTRNSGYPPTGTPGSGQELPLEELTTPLPPASGGNRKPRRGAHPLDGIRSVAPGPRWTAFVNRLEQFAGAAAYELHLDDLVLLGLDSQNRAVVAGRCCWNPAHVAGVVARAAADADFEVRLATVAEAESVSGHRP